MSASDCRSEQGVLVGLVDGMIAAARVVARHLRTAPSGAVGDELRNALADIAADEDVALLVAAASLTAQPVGSPPGWVGA